MELTAPPGWAWWAVVIFLSVKEAWALISKMLPVHQRQKAAKEAKDIECREREAQAMEIISRTLTVTAERMITIEDNQGVMIAALNETNKGLAVLLDRQERAKKEGEKSNG